MSTQDLISMLWNLCHVLRDDGVTYHEYLNELTYLIFLKMVEETGQDNLIPENYRWSDIENFNAARLPRIPHNPRMDYRELRARFCFVSLTAKAIWLMFGV